MNRLVIVGNGFDLAHGLPTGYRNFIDWYWDNVLSTFKKPSTFDFTDKFIEIELRFNSRSQHEAAEKLLSLKDYSQLKELITTYSEPYHSKAIAERYNRSKLEFHNSFFKAICDKRNIQNWVDIENEYYKILKDCLKKSGKVI